MKNKSVIMSLILGIVSFFFSLNYVEAKNFEFGFEAYNVTSACDLTVRNGSYNCLDSLLKGDLDRYKINDGHISEGQTIMVVMTQNLSSDSDIANLKLTVNYNKNILTLVDSAANEYTDDADEEVPGGIYSVYDYDRKGNPIHNWDPKATEGDGEFTFWTRDTELTDPKALVNSGVLDAMFFTVGAMTSGSSTTISYLSTDDEKVSLSNYSFADLKPYSTFKSISLSALSSQSSDGTLKELIATGSNNLTYNFDFKPSDDAALNYSFVVPNAVTSITFTGLPTDSNVKDITVLNQAQTLNVGDNNITIAVTAEDGKVTNYQIRVRRLSNDATLKEVTATNGITFSLPSNPTGTTVTVPSVTVPYKTTSTDVTATPTYDETVVGVGRSHATIASGLGTWNIATDNATNKSNTFPIVVNAEDCQYNATDVPGNVCTSKTYNFTIIRTAPSQDFKLSDLTVDGITVPGFSPTTYEYNLPDAPANKASITIGATLSDSKNSFTSDSKLGTQVVQTGDNQYKIIVQGEDGLPKSKQEYTINLHKLSNDTRLESLVVDSNPKSTLSPAFGDSVSGEYTYTYDPTVTSISVTATVKDIGKASVSIIDMSSSETPDNSSKAPNTDTKTFGIETTKVGVIVTAEDGTIQVYKVTLNRTQSANNYLDGLTISPGTLNETFSSTKQDYTATVEANVSSITVTPVLSDPANSRVESITGNDNLNFGPNNVMVVVRSEAGERRQYVITVTRKKYDIDTLSGITYKYDDGTVNNVSPFNQATLKYDLSTAENPISYDTKKITIGFTKGEEHEIVTGNVGEITLNNFSERTVEQVTVDGKQKNVFKYVFRINVQSHDEANSKIYELTLYQECNPDNATTGVSVHGKAATPDPTNPNIYNVTLDNIYTTLAPSNVVISTNAPDGNVQKQTETIDLSTTSVNIFRYTITAENGEVASYEIHITRSPSNDANITRIDLTTNEGKTAYCVMNASENSCTINVETDTTGYRLNAKINASSTINPANDTPYDMPLDGPSTQTRTLVVTPETGEADKKEYTITIKRAASSDAKLSSITITDADGKNYGISATDFNPDKTSYSVKLPYNVDTVYINAELSDKKATISETLPIEAVVGFDGVVTKEINILAEDKNATKTYYINFTREKSTVATLKDLKIDGTTIQGFNPDATNLSYPIVEYLKTTIDVNAITTDDNAKVTSMKVTYANGTSKVYPFAASNDITQTIDLATGTNTIEVTTAPQAGGSGKTYTVVVERQKNNNADIDGIKIAEISATVDPTNKYSYNVTVGNEVKVANKSNVVVAVKTGATSSDAKATYDVIETPLKTIDSEGRQIINQVLINVTPEEGAVQTYVLNVIREASDIATLERLNLYIDGKAAIYRTCQFGAEYSNNSCSLDVPANVKSIKLEGITTDPTATVSYQDLIGNTGPEFNWDAAQQSKIIAVTVLAEDRNTTKPYRVTITRGANDDKGVEDITAVGDNGKDYIVNGVGPTTYQVTVDGDVNELTLDITPSGTNAEVIYKGGINEDTPVYSIGNGKTVLYFDIKSEAGITQPYTVEVTRLAKTDNTLSYLNYTLSDGNVGVISLEEGVFNYTIPDVAYSISSIEIRAIAHDAPDATVSGDVGNQVIKTGSNTYTITVTAQNNVEQDYTITVNRAKNTDATLKILTLSGYTLDPVTSTSNLKRVFEYNVTVEETTTSIPASSITAVATDDNAKVTKTSGDLTLTNSGEYRYTITVQPEDENADPQEYVIVITKPESTDTRLGNLEIQNGTISPEFNKDIRTGYTILVPYDSETFTITGTPNVSTSNVKSGNGTYNVDETPKVTIEVESESKDTGTYEFNIVRAASRDSSLATLSVSGYRFTETFSPSKLNYSIGDIVVSTDKIVVNANPTNTNATWKYYYGTANIASCDNQTSCEISLENVIGEKTISIAVQAADNVADHSTTYTIKYNKVQSSNNYLSDIVVKKTSDGSTINLDKTFSKVIPDYNVSVANDVESVTLNLTTEDANASISVNGSTSRLHSLTYVFDNLEEGNNTATITVTAANGNTNPYYVYINRAVSVASNDATLSSLKVYNGVDTTKEYALSPNFSPNREQYNIGEIPYSLESLKIDARVNMSGATVTYYIDGVSQTAADGIITIPKVNGEKTITVKVLAEDKHTEKNYTITYTKTAETEAELSNIVVDGYTISPNFSPDTSSYTVEIPEDVDAIDLTAIAKGKNATISVNGETVSSGIPKRITNLPVGTKNIDITVTAEDGTMEYYTLSVKRGNDTLDVITSVEYGHTITDDYVMTVALDTTVDVFKTQFDNEVEELVLYKADGVTKVTEGNVSTGMILKLERDGQVLDSKIAILRGDTNGDGKITVNDAALIVNHALGLPLTGAYLVAADVNKDDKCTVNDAAMIVNHTLGNSLY